MCSLVLLCSLKGFNLVVVAIVLHTKVIGLARYSVYFFAWNAPASIVHSVSI